MSNKYNLKWNSHHGETFQSFENLRQREMFVDVTMSCNGQFLKAHKLVLCAGSGYFERILNKDGPGMPTIHFYGVEMQLLKLLVEFMYCGEVEVPAMDLEKFIEVAENLEVKGLKGDKSKSSGSHSVGSSTTIPVSDVHDALAHKRKSSAHTWQEFDEPQFHSAKVPRSQPPMLRNRQKFIGQHTPQQQLAPSSSHIHYAQPEPSTSASTDEVVIKEEDEEDEISDIHVMDSSSAAEEEWDDQSQAAYTAEGMEGEPETPINIPPEVDPQTVSYVQSYVWCGKLQLTGTRLYFCPVCPYSTAHKGHAEYHTRKHSKEKPFQCPICFKSFTQKSNLKYHCAVTVTYVQSYMWCGKLQPTGTKLYFCPACPYSTAHKGHAEYHTHKHSKEKPYQCPICFKAFARKFHLKNHCALTISYVQSYVWCGKTRRAGKKWYFCPVCPYSTPRKNHAEYHSRKHTREKPFQCPVCLKRFSQNAHLRTHCMHLHSSLKRIEI
ncbi:unnamed protein product, partial [Darwinula stevensoni]